MPEITLTQSITIVVQSLEKANRQGAFTIAESAVIFTAISKLSELLKEDEKDEKE